MRGYLVLITLSVAVGAQADVDNACMNRCTMAGSQFRFCQQACSYDPQNSGNGGFFGAYNRTQQQRLDIQRQQLEIVQLKQKQRQIEQQQRLIEELRDQQQQQAGQ